jgi:L-alanine-DL-glutamate epimerase-like enolase superfamily enzyme
MASIPNGLIIEDMGLLEDIFVDPPKPVNGVIKAPETPGHGIRIKPDFIEEYRVE